MRNDNGSDQGSRVKEVRVFGFWMYMFKVEQQYLYFLFFITFIEVKSNSIF